MQTRVVVALGAALVVVAAGLTPARAAEPQPGTNPRVDALIAQMTLDEKITMLHGGTDPASLGQAGYVPGVERLGIPPLRLADGPAGVRVTERATAMPAPEALAATWSPGLARDYGRVIGRDGQALGQDVLLSPMVNLLRVPYAGRNFETFGEDPLLAGRTVAAEIKGIQDEGLIATVKHYAANNQETNRQTVDVKVSERTLHEMELSAFQDAVDAGVGAVMCAYNKVNGVYACENDSLLNDILRDDWGFGGWVMTDWGARHTAFGAHALTNGLDMEMPRACYFDTAPTTSAGFGCTAGEQTVAGAVAAGDLPEAAVDQAVRHVLVQMDRFKLLDGPKVRPSRDRDGGAQVADDVATAGAVLLSNTRNALPLDDRDLRSVAVVGPTAKAPLIGGGGSARVIPESAESPLDALERRAGANAGIAWSPGLDLDGVAVPSSALSPPAGSTGPGLLRSGTGANAGAPSRVDAQIDYTEGGQTPDASLPPGPWEWTGALDVPAEGDYDLSLQFSGGNSALYLDGSTTATVSAGGLFGGGSLIPTEDGLNNSSKRVHLTAGSHQIRITATPPTSGSPQFRFAWTSAERRAAAVSAAVRSARGARTAVVFAYDEGTEGADRSSLSLPNDQDGLVSAVARANHNTVVVLNTGDPVLTPWAKDARAILQMWYPGQEGADATVKLLLGDANPSGKLPMTYPVEEDDSLVAGHPERFPGVENVQQYSEGIFSGYRWYDQQDVAPRFEFGRGLSYTTFDYKDLQIKAVGDTYDVSFKLRNTGDEDGTEVPQVYAGPPIGAPVAMAEKSLAGFERVELEAGQERRVTVPLDPRRLGYWSEDADQWVTPTGSKPIYVGSSSRDIRLSGETEPAPSPPGGGTPGGGTPGGGTPATRVRCTVPKLKGFTLKRAKARLRKAHCGIGKTKKVRTRRHRAGRVFAQSRKPKWTGPRGTRVRLTVAVKPRRR